MKYYFMISSSIVLIDLVDQLIDDTIKDKMMILLGKLLEKCVKERLLANIFFQLKKSKFATNNIMICSKTYIFSRITKNL